MKAMPYPSRTLLTKNTVNAITVFWAILGFGLSVFYPTSDWQALLGVLMVSQAFSGRLTWIRFRRTEEAILPDFLTMYLFSQFGFKTLTAIGIYLSQGINEIGMAMGGIKAHLFKYVALFVEGKYLQAHHDGMLTDRVGQSALTFPSTGGSTLVLNQYSSSINSIQVHVGLSIHFDWKP